MGRHERGRVLCGPLRAGRAARHAVSRAAERPGERLCSCRHRGSGSRGLVRHHRGRQPLLRPHLAGGARPRAGATAHQRAAAGQRRPHLGRDRAQRPGRLAGRPLGAPDQPDRPARRPHRLAVRGQRGAYLGRHAHRGRVLAERPGMALLRRRDPGAGRRAGLRFRAGRARQPLAGDGARAQPVDRGGRLCRGRSAGGHARQRALSCARWRALVRHGVGGRVPPGRRPLGGRDRRGDRAAQRRGRERHRPDRRRQPVGQQLQQRALASAGRPMGAHGRRAPQPQAALAARGRNQPVGRVAAGPVAFRRPHLAELHGRHPPRRIDLRAEPGRRGRRVDRLQRRPRALSPRPVRALGAGGFAEPAARDGRRLPAGRPHVGGSAPAGRRPDDARPGAHLPDRAARPGRGPAGLRGCPDHGLSRYCPTRGHAHPAHHGPRYGLQLFGAAGSHAHRAAAGPAAGRRAGAHGCALCDPRHRRHRGRGVERHRRRWAARPRARPPAERREGRPPARGARTGLQPVCVGRAHPRYGHVLRSRGSGAAHLQRAAPEQHHDPRRAADGQDHAAVSDSHATAQRRGSRMGVHPGVCGSGGDAAGSFLPSPDGRHLGRAPGLHDGQRARAELRHPDAGTVHRPRVRRGLAGPVGARQAGRRPAQGARHPADGRDGCHKQL
ncbi:MAG: hypothetical protein BWY52_02725 [Chloroflexi bacterium ADurb.Bin325]|nr:MAG: hypothetical protein BWY52_02725 [Chloroflexi bacterium ADurb.Bin325]